VDIAALYLNALASRDPSDVPLAADVRRINNGTVTASGIDELCDVIRREPPLTTGALRWLSTGDEVAVFYDLEADLGGPEPICAAVGERFVVHDGRIDEIEVVHAAVPRDAATWEASETNGPPDDVTTPTKAYLAALVSHRGAQVPLAAEVRRVENGRQTGNGAEHLRSSLESEIMQTVQGISGERWISAGDGAVVFYDLHARAGEADMVVRIAERFRVRNGALTEIEAVFAPIDAPG
jgi:hypothetical protein